MKRHVRQTLVTPGPTDLLRASEVISPEDNNWQYTGEFYAESIAPCEEAKVFELGCNVDYGVDGKPVVPADPSRDNFPEVERFNVVFSDRCSILGSNTWKNVEDYAAHGLKVRELKVLDQVVWGVENAPYAVPNAFTTPFFADILNSGTAYNNVFEAVTALEVEMYKKTDDVHIHVPLLALPYLAPYVHHDAASDFYKTMAGSTIVVGRNYDGSAPGPVAPVAGTSYIYASPKLLFLQGDELEFGRMSVGDVPDLRQNEHVVIVERAWGYWVDNCVGVIGANATLAHA